MPIDPNAAIEITAYEWVPAFAQGFVRDLRARWACEEMGLAYRERLIDVMNKPEWYFEEQPFGQVPHLRDGEVSLFESGAILIHLGEKGGLLPAQGQARASTLSWTLAAFNSIEPMVFEMSNVDVFSKKEPWAPLRRPSLLAALGKRLDGLQAALGSREWLAGAFSIADIAMATVLREVGRTELIADRPALAGYLEKATARPAFAKALQDQLATFAAHAPRPMEGA